MDITVIRTGIYGKEAVSRFVQMVNIARNEVSIRTFVADDGELIIKTPLKDFHAWVRRNLSINNFYITDYVGNGKGNCGQNNEYRRYYVEKAFSKWARHRFEEAGLGFETKLCDRILYKLLSGYKRSSMIDGYGKDDINEVIGKPLDPIQTFKNKCLNDNKLQELENIDKVSETYYKTSRKIVDKFSEFKTLIKYSKDENELNNNKLKFKELQDNLATIFEAFK